MFKTSKDYTIYKIELIEIIQEAVHTYTYIFKKPEDLHWSEGAHTHLALDHFDESIGWWQKKDVRHFSIMSLEKENVVSMTTRLPEPHSDFKNHLKESKIGDNFFLFKVGSRLEILRDDKPIVMLSAGVGIATLRPLLKAIEDNSNGIGLVHHINIDSSGEFLFKEEFEGFNKNIQEFTNEYVKSRDAFYEGLHKLLRNKDFANANFYIIGSDDFILSIRDVLMEYNVSDHQLRLDKVDEFYQLLNEKIS